MKRSLGGFAILAIALLSGGKAQVAISPEPRPGLPPQSGVGSPLNPVNPGTTTPPIPSLPQPVMPTPENPVVVVVGSPPGEVLHANYVKSMKALNASPGGLQVPFAAPAGYHWDFLDEGPDYGLGYSRAPYPGYNAQLVPDKGPSYDEWLGRLIIYVASVGGWQYVRWNDDGSVSFTG